jgi:HEAT repeat protein
VSASWPGRILARIGPRYYLPSHHPDPLVRRAIVWVMGQRADPADIWRLANAVKDEDKLVRSCAAASLGRITHEKTLALLTAPCVILGRAPGPTPRPPWVEPPPDGLPDLLADSLADPHPAVRFAATAALRGSARCLSSMDEELSSSVRQDQRGVLGRLGHGA